MTYLVFVDQPDDWPETVWIEADTEDEARDRAAEFCCDENEVSPCRPVGPAKRVIITVPSDDEHVKGEYPRAGTEVEVWRISVA